MCDEMMLLPTCWNWREDELVGHNARAGHLFPHAMAASGEGGFLLSISTFSAQTIFSTQRSMGSGESKGAANMHIVQDPLLGLVLINLGQSTMPYACQRDCFHFHYYQVLLMLPTS